MFAYAWQLIDDGNGDGLVQRGERYRLAVQIKNTGAGPTQEATVLLRNATGDGVVLDKSRAELKEPLAPDSPKDLRSANEVGEWQTREQLSMLWVPIAARMKRCIA